MLDLINAEVNIVRPVIQTHMTHFDETPVFGAEISDMEPNLWQRFRTEQSDSDDQIFLEKIGLASRGDYGYAVPSIAGVLMASSDPTRWLPSAFIQAVAYAGESVVPTEGATVYQLDAKDIKGPLDEQIDQALAFVVRNMKVLATKDIGRRDITQYDLTAVFEGVVNAVAHRDYSIYGAKIRLQMFSDRLELFSPGALANTMDIDSMKLRQSARNEVLTSLLARIPVHGRDVIQTSRSSLMDRRGEGVPIIISRSRSRSGKDPIYKVLGDELQLTIFGATAASLEAGSS